ncbi:response regulator transcription factor [Aestuariimicrobium ganziense]|uniref:response regulator transcription factor n=1 Tax=Aestuariimicrobium ganziense TaxID=2773677 RepID=UPI0038B33598
MTRVAGGGVVLDPEVVAQVFGRQGSSALAQLTPPEREVLELMAQGHTNAVIAQRLVVTEGAVEKHSQRLFAKLGLSDDHLVHRRVPAVPPARVVTVAPNPRFS